MKHKKVYRVAAYLLERYGIELVLEPGHDDFEVAELKNKKMFVNPEARDEISLLFVIAHLFGHMVQFAHKYEKYQYLVETCHSPAPLSPDILTEQFQKDFHKYEAEAYRYGKALLVRVLGKKYIAKLDIAYQIYFDTDFIVFFDYLRTGIQLTPKEFQQLLKANSKHWKNRYFESMIPLPLPKTIEFEKPIKAIVF